MFQLNDANGIDQNLEPELTTKKPKGSFTKKLNHNMLSKISEVDLEMEYEDNLIQGKYPFSEDF
jgi:hypothetical protein